jgi:RHS repeat-associated protein
MSTRKLTNVAATVTDSYVYDAFGVAIDHNGSSENNYLYRSEQYDFTLDKYYLRARYYDQNIGRFSSMDSFKGRIAQPLSLQKYIYSNANPISFHDPTGMITVPETMFTVAVITTLTSLVLAGFEHLLSLDRDPIRWKAKIYDVGFSLKKVDGQVSYVSAESGCINNSLYEDTKGVGEFLLLYVGVSTPTPELLGKGAGGLAPGGIDPQVGDATLFTPGLLGPEPKWLSGLCSVSQVSIALGKGIAYGTFTMGTGVGDFTLTPSIISGFTIGADYLAGISIPISLEMKQCNQ